MNNLQKIKNFFSNIGLVSIALKYGQFDYKGLTETKFISKLPKSVYSIVGDDELVEFLTNYAIENYFVEVANPLICDPHCIVLVQTLKSRIEMQKYWASLFLTFLKQFADDSKSLTATFYCADYADLIFGKAKPEVKTDLSIVYYDDEYEPCGEEIGGLDDQIAFLDREKCKLELTNNFLQTVTGGDYTIFFSHYFAMLCEVAVVTFNGEDVLDRECNDDFLNYCFCNFEF